MADSLFTKIIKREIPADIVYEDNDLIAINDINPQSPVHILIIPKKPLASINEAEQEDAALLGKIILVAKKLAEEKGVAEDGYRLVINTNAGAGQTVFHLHCHLLGGRSFHWPPG